MWIHVYRLLMCLLLWELIDSYEYCRGGRDVTLCGKKRHIACHPEQMKEKQETGLNPKLLAIVPTTSQVRRILRDGHNKYRNQLACGEIKDSASTPFPKATRMRELIWDDELAFLAREHAKQCVFAHDECRNTFRFRFSGQNLAWWGKSEFSKIIPLLEEGPRTWFEEYKNIQNAVTAASEFPPKAEGQTGHFTLMAQDYVSRFGCALSVWEEQGSSPWQYLLTCNYDMTNIQHKAIYKYSTSDAATECDFWGNEKSDKYPCLCKNNGNMKYISTLGSNLPSDGDDAPPPSGGDGAPPPSGGDGGAPPSGGNDTQPGNGTLTPSGDGTTSAPLDEGKGGGEGDGIDAPVEADPRPVLNTTSWCTPKWLSDACAYMKVKGKNLHVFCNGSNGYKQAHKKGTYGYNLEMTKDLRSHILLKHNTLRNKLACGNVIGHKGIMFPTATRQRVLMWDWELAFTAEAHTKNAIFGHSTCQGTNKYKLAGQNVAESENTATDYKRLISGWMSAFFTNEAAVVLDPVGCAKSFSKCKAL